jgi:hypothetical protein
MNVDKERVERYLFEIKSRHREIEKLLLQSSDASLLEAPWILRGLKYCLIEIAEAMANALQHINRRKDGRTLALIPEQIHGSPLDVPSIKATISTKELVEILRKQRGRTRGRSRRV